MAVHRMQRCCCSGRDKTHHSVPPRLVRDGRDIPGADFIPGKPACFLQGSCVRVEIAEGIREDPARGAELLANPAKKFLPCQPEESIGK